MSPRRATLAALTVIGLAWLILIAPNGGPLSGRHELTQQPSDLDMHYVAAIAAMHDPIDWGQPLAISTLRYPLGTSLLLTEAFPLLTLPLRVAWQADLRLDPPLVLDLWVGLTMLASPFALYALSRRLGAGRVVAVVSSCAALLLPPLFAWQMSGSQGLASWPLLALMLAELIALESKSSSRRWVAALIAAALWWAHPALGAMGAGLAATHALLLFTRGDRRAPIPLIASLLGVALLRLADIRVPEGFDYVGASPDFTSALPGLLTLFPAGAGALISWGLAALVSFTLVQRSFWRLAPLAAAASLVYAIASLGSSGVGGGPLPAGLLRSTPFAPFDATDRFYAIPAMIGLLLLPARLEQLLRTRSRARSGVVIASLIAALLGSSYLPNLIEVGRARLDTAAAVGLLGEAAGSAYDATFDLERAAWRRAVESHDRVLFLPHIECEILRLITLGGEGAASGSTYDFARLEIVTNPGDRESRRSLANIQRNQMRSALLASELSKPAYSFYTARDLTSPERQECSHATEMSPAGTLVVGSTDLDALEGYDAPWQRIVAEMPYCSGPLDGRYLISVRVCSDTAEPLRRLEDELATIVTDSSRDRLSHLLDEGAARAIVWR